MARLVRTRFAPSPTGEFHLGGLRTALYAFAFAAKHEGEFLLRIEDTDATRTVPGAEERIKQALRACGLEYSPPVVKQSEHLPRYRRRAEELLERGHAYRCFCSKERLEALRERQARENQPTRYDGKCSHLSAEESSRRRHEKHVVRMKTKRTGEVAWEDAVVGTVRFSNATLDDQVLLKEDGFPTYHLASVVDDHDSSITHVIRGDEWLSSTPKHLILHAMFGWTAPVYAHLPLLLTKDGKKLSKRSAMGMPVLKLLEENYLPSTLLNFVALLGWGDHEAMAGRWGSDADANNNNNLIFTLEEFVKMFTLEKVSRSAAVVDEERLAWINSMHIRRVVGTGNNAAAGKGGPQEEYLHLKSRVRAKLEAEMRRRGLGEEAMVGQQKLEEVLELLKDRVRVFDDFVRLGLHFFLSPAHFRADREMFVKEMGVNNLGMAARVLEEGSRRALSTGEPLTSLGDIHDTLSVPKKLALSSLRLALTGGLVGAPVPDTARVLGREETGRRLQQAIKIIEGK